MNIVTPRAGVCGDVIQQIFIGKCHTQARQIATINVLIDIRILTCTRYHCNKNAMINSMNNGQKRADPPQGHARHRCWYRFA